ncbi:MAG TPA: N-acetyl-gamma-glutamyl-phosphate reductase [Clostridiales bacterium]|nr:N-acetyl-gamma-glutamyl-phosphate reductase [Clostridiales bacterium]HPV02300.1 N-acetyl-gamma-glutamyl-phosphate reductase [Clostridiales bacterium]
MVYKVFVDGQEGTTGLEINERLHGRKDIELLKISPEKRKDINERKKYINEADIVFLCLPDDAAREAVSLVENENTRIIDASTAHRTNDGWVYGFPELSSWHRERIAASGRVAVPGCYATGFTALMYPLVKAGIVPADYPVTCHAVSGYSGGGKKRIAEYAEADTSDEAIKSPRFYSLTLRHKHLPEMQKVTGLSRPPLFTPIIGYNYRGMTVAIPLHSRLLPGKDSAESICDFLYKYYKDQHFIKVFPYGSEGGIVDGFLAATGCNGTNMLEIYVAGNEEHILLTARLDNLGKGASGAAVQCMNIMMGIDERTGLE